MCRSTCITDRRTIAVGIALDGPMHGLISTETVCGTVYGPWPGETDNDGRLNGSVLWSC